MISRRTFAGALLLGGHVLWAGCTTSGERNAMLDVVRRLNTLEAEVPTNPRDNEYVLKRMEFARAAVVNGAYERAEVRLTQAFQQLESEHSNVAAAISSEEHKFYKGETYERAMLCFYLGYIKYFLGDYNEARICFERAIAADRAAVVKESTPISHGEDFGLAYYWLGKAYQKLNNMDAAAIAFKRAGQQVQRAEAEGERQEDCAKATVVAKRRQEGEAWAYRTFHDPKQPKWYIAETADLSDGEAAVRACAAPGSRLPAPVIRRSQSRAEFLTPRFQGQVNLTLTIELGDCPWKYLTGWKQELTKIARPLILPYSVDVYIDGYSAGPAFKLLDLWDQAATQDRISEKDAAQVAKSVTKGILSQLPYIGSVAGHWDVSGDWRYWDSLPGRVYVYAARLAPGRHTVRLSIRDANGAALPRWTNTYYGVFVPASGEACVLLNPRFDGDNVLPEAQRAVALSAGAKPESADELYQPSESARSGRKRSFSGGRRP